MSRSEQGDLQRTVHEHGVRTHLPVLHSAADQDPLSAVNGNDAVARTLRAHATALGFAAIGVAAIEPFSVARARLENWLANGYHGEMHYLAGSVDRADPAALLDQARSLVVVALPHPTRVDSDVESSLADRELTGVIARYARGADYHDVLRQKLHQLADFVATLVGRPVLARACVDTAPLLEREAARLTGVGFIGKNTLTILPGIGSYVLLGELLLDIPLELTQAINPGCGTCRACLDACPTGAFVDAHTLDARRCISYLTIEFRGSIPRQYRRAIGPMVFGCDLCQEACPYNASPRPKPVAPELAWRRELVDVDLVALLQLTASGYRRLVKGTALRRANRETLQRNAAIALGNAGDPRAVSALIDALLKHKSPLVREHAAWALGEIGSTEARVALEQARGDTDQRVREEAALVLEELRAKAS